MTRVGVNKNPSTFCIAPTPSSSSLSSFHIFQWKTKISRKEHVFHHPSGFPDDNGKLRMILCMWWGLKAASLPPTPEERVVRLPSYSSPSAAADGRWQFLCDSKRAHFHSKTILNKNGLWMKEKIVVGSFTLPISDLPPHTEYLSSPPPKGGGTKVWGSHCYLASGRSRWFFVRSEGGKINALARSVSCNIFALRSRRRLFLQLVQFH